MKSKEEVLENYKEIIKEKINKNKKVWVKSSAKGKSFKSLKSVPLKLRKIIKGNDMYAINIWINVFTGEVVFEQPNPRTILIDDETISVSIDKECDAIKITKIEFNVPSMWANNVIDEFNKCNIIGGPKVCLSYIFRDKTIICSKGCDMYHDSQSLDKLNPVIIDAPKINVKTAQEEYGGFGLFVDTYGKNKKVEKAFSKFFEIGLISGNIYTNFNDLYDTLNFLCTKDILYKDTPKQKKVDELIKIELPKVEISFKNNSKLICVANRVNSEYAVLRYFKPTLNKTPYEISRLYVSKKDYYFVRKNQEGKFCVCNNKLNAEHFESDDMVLDSEDIFDGTMLEYFKDIYKKLKTNERGKALYILTTQPTFEKLYKMGFKFVCIRYINNFNGNISWKKHLENYFGPINDIKEKNINKLLGFNKYQLEKLKIYQDTYRFYEEWVPIWPGSYTVTEHKVMKCGLGACFKILFKNVKSFNDMDNTSFDKIFDIFDTTISNTEYNLSSILHDLYKSMKAVLEMYSFKICLNVLPSLKNTIIDENCSDGINAHYLKTFTDYLNLIKKLDKINEIKPYFNTKEDLVRMHDDMVAIYNLQKDKFETEKFKKRSSFWKKWEYSEDDNFIAIAPTLPADLAVEGIELHHCVKSYIDRVTDGKTNIMFIRKKDESEKPFFTVEISNRGTIEQVHGFANRNVSTEPGLEDFVKKWAIEKNLKINSINKVR